MVVLEKKSYPRDKICAGALAARADAVLRQIGITVDTPSAAIDALSLRFGDRTVVVREPGAARVVRRVEFDHALATAAAARGIEIREGCGVSAIEPADDQIRLRLDDGAEIAARAVVGADGVAGVVRRGAGLSRPRLRAQVIEVDTGPGEGDPPGDALHFDFRYRDLHGYAWDFPTVVDGERKVCRGVYRIGTGPTPLVDWLRRYLAERGLDIDHHRVKQYAEHGFLPTEPIARPRVLMVGEAAGIDIATGEGIAQAVEYGALAGSYLADAFARGDLAFDDWADRVRRRGVGKRLILRFAAYKSFYGPDRDIMQQIAPRIPSVLQIALRDFAGKPLTGGLLARGVRELAGPLLRFGPGMLRRSFAAS